MLYQISILIILGCFYPAVLSRPSVSLRNDGYGNYNFQYDVHHPKGSSRGHMRFGSTSSRHTDLHRDLIVKTNQADDYAARSPLSSVHNPDSYQAEKEARRPQDYAHSPYESEVLHEPRPIYPSPYDSTERQLGSHNEAYKSPVSLANHQSPVHSASVPEANYYPPQPIHGGEGPNQVLEHGNPNTFVSNALLSQEPISQVSEPAFNEVREDYASNHGDSLNVQAVPLGPKYHLIPSGPPYVVDSHTTEIIHPPLPKDPIVVQQPVDLVPPSQEAISYEPNISLPPKAEVIQPVLSQAFQLPEAPLPDHSPILSGPKVEDVQQANYDEETVHPPSNPILVKEPVDLSLPSNQPDSNITPLSNVHPPTVSHAFRLPLLPTASVHLPIPTGPSADAVQSVAHSQQTVGITPVDSISHSLSDVPPPPVSHAFRLPLLSTAFEHSPIPTGPSADAVQSVAHLQQTAGITPVDPISHSTRLLIPGPVTLGVRSAPKSLSDSLLPSKHDAIALDPQDIKNESANSVSGFSEIDSPIDSHVSSPISHAFRLSLPKLFSNQDQASVPELKSFEIKEGPSPFSEIWSPEPSQNIPNSPLGSSIISDTPLLDPETSEKQSEN